MHSYLPGLLLHHPSSATFQILKFKTEIPQILFGKTCRGRYGLGGTSAYYSTQEKGSDRDPHVRAHGEIPRGQRWRRKRGLHMAPAQSSRTAQAARLPWQQIIKQSVASSLISADAHAQTRSVPRSNEKVSRDPAVINNTRERERGGC
jgi:hypothetical protein